MKLDNIFKFCIANLISFVIMAATNFISSDFAFMCSSAWLLLIFLFYIFGFVLHFSGIGTNRNKKKPEKLNPGGYVTRFFADSREKPVAELLMDIEAHDNVLEHLKKNGFTGSAIINDGHGIINFARITAVVDVEVPTGEELAAYRAREAYKVEK